MAEWDMAGPEASPARLIEQDAVRNFGQMAQANYTNTLAIKQQDEMDRAKKIAQAFSSPGSPSPDGKPLTEDQQIYADADKLRRLGYPEEASKVVANGALAASRMAATRAEQSQLHLKQIQAADDNLTAISGYYDGVTSQEEFDRANGIINAMTGIPSLLAGQTWSPHLGTLLKNSQMKAKDRALLPYQQGRLQAQIDSQKALTDLREAQEALAKAREVAAREKSDRDEKAGGGKVKDVGNPSNVETEQSALLIRQRYPDLPAKDLANFAYAVAAEAKAIRKQTGVSADVANQRAIENHADEIAPISVTEKVLGSEALGSALGWTSTRSGYTPRTRQPEGSLPEKATKGMAYQPGKSYIFPNGQTGLYRGRDASGKLLIDWK